MTRLSIKDRFKEYQSHYFKTSDFITSDQDTELVINFKLFSRIVIFLRNDIIQNKRKFVLTFNAFAKTNETTTL